MSVSSRHEDTLDGRLEPFDPAYQIDVTVEVDLSVASEPHVQHCAWMLVNILCRLEGIVGRIGFVCPSAAPLQRQIIPGATEVYFRDAILNGTKALAVVPCIIGEVSGMTLVVGRKPKNGGLAVSGCGWVGGISTSQIPEWEISSTLPFGPYIAACLAAGEVFKRARLPEETYSMPDRAFYSAWDLRAGENLPMNGPGELAVNIDVLIAGVGAVGSAVILCLWACDGITGSAVLADCDRSGLDETNLNRYVLFTKESLGEPKAAEAARIAANCGISWDPRGSAAEQVGDFQWVSKRVVSAVDTNRARNALQDRYPARIIGASANDLRAEVVRCGPPGVGVCLRCYNPPEQLKSDEELRTGLSEKKEEEIASLAASADVSPAAAHEWIASGKCGMAGERLLSQLRRTADEPDQFAVGFVSVLAGVLAAAELVKDTSGAAVPLNNDRQRATFQFWTPASSVNSSKRVRPDPGCPKCRSNRAIQIATRRFEALLPTRSSQPPAGAGLFSFVEPPKGHHEL